MRDQSLKWRNQGSPIKGNLSISRSGSNLQNSLINVCYFLSKNSLTSRSPFDGRLELSEIGLQDIFLDHSMGVEKRTIDGNGVTHHIDKTIPVTIEQGKNDML